MFKSVLLTNLDWSRLLHIGHVCRRVFMERDKVDIYKNAKRTGPISAADPGKGPGRPAPPPPASLMFRAKWGPNGRKICFWNPPPAPLPEDLDLPLHILPLDRTSLVNKRFITWPKRKGCRRTSGRSGKTSPIRTQDLPYLARWQSQPYTINLIIWSFVWSCHVSDKQPVKFLKYIELARTVKSAALDHIYSLFKQNIKSGNASGEGNAGERWKTTIGLISKKATLHAQQTFFLRPFFLALYSKFVDMTIILSLIL